MAITKMTRSMMATDAIVNSGIIIMWYGTVASIPTGWFHCDGTNGTPDLRDKMIIGASADSGGQAKSYITGAWTKSGGSKDSIAVSHTHTATSTDAGHTHTMGPFTAWHGRDGSFHGSTTPTWSSGDSQTNTVSAYSIGSGASSISTTVNSTGSSGTNANLPPYYALTHIMKA